MYYHWTQEKASAKFAEYGWELLGEYKGANIPVLAKCPCDNIIEKRLGNLKNHSLCLKCTNREKLSFEYVKNYFEQNNCVLLEDSYINNEIKMRYICVCKNESSIRFDDFKNGVRCIKCRSVSNSQKRRHSYEYVKKYFEDKGCELLSKEYKNVSTPLDYICKCGTPSKICFGSLKAGRTCKPCGFEKNRENATGPNNPNWKPDREKHKKDVKFKDQCRLMLRSTLERLGIEKTKRTEEHLGYSYSEYAEYKEGLLQAANYIDDPSNDHIFPIQAFINHGIYNERLINCFDNLQVLSRSENSKKSDNYNKEDFSSWLLPRGYNIYKDYLNDYQI